MRGIETRIQDIRHMVFTEVARMAYQDEVPVEKQIEKIPYEIIPGDVANFRNDVFLERAIVGERDFHAGMPAIRRRSPKTSKRRTARKHITRRR